MAPVKFAFPEVDQHTEAHRHAAHKELVCGFLSAAAALGNSRLDFYIAAIDLVRLMLHTRGLELKGAFQDETVRQRVTRSAATPDQVHRLCLLGQLLGKVKQPIGYLCSQTLWPPALRSVLGCTPSRQVEERTRITLAMDLPPEN